MENKRKVIFTLLAVLPYCGFSQSWIGQPSVRNEYRLLECFYEGASLKSENSIKDETDNWKVETLTLPLGQGGKQYTFTFTAKRPMDEAGVAVAFDEADWSSDNYVMIPASVYNGNRQRIVNRAYASGMDKSDYRRKDLALTSNPIPQLSPDFGKPSRLEVLVNNAATPAITYFSRRQQRGTLLLTDQGIDWNGEVKDHGLIVEESRDRSRASFVISAPGVREKKPEFIGFSASPDRGLKVDKGDRITIRVTRLDFYCESTSMLLHQFMLHRKQHVESEAPRNLMPMSEVLTRMTRDIEERYIKKGDWEYYCPENADWISFGWVGGVMNTYPMLALGDDEHLRRVCNTFDFALPRARGKSGYYYDVLGSDGKMLLRDGARNYPGIALTRRNSDVLYWMVKQFNLLKLQGREDKINRMWEEQIHLLADAFASTWRKFHTWGNYVDVETGEVALFNTTGGAMAIAGLTLAAAYYDQPEYLQIAEEAARYYYDDFSLVGFTSGGCGDILQNADSETAIAFTTSLMTLYEATGKKIYLQQCRSLADLCATWTVSYKYKLPANTPLAKLDANLTGAVWASTQNKHGAPGFCTQSGDALFKLYRATGEKMYAELLRDVIHAHAEGIQPNGKITERLTYCDADSRGCRGDGGQTGWNETNGAMMAIEIPGIYVNTSRSEVYVFDHVKARMLSNDADKVVLEITNPTAFDAVVTVLCEDEADSMKPLGDNAFLNWKDKIEVKAGQTKKFKINKAS